MKKTISICLCLIISVALFTACNEQGVPVPDSTSAQPAVAEEPGQSSAEPGQNSAEPVQEPEFQRQIHTEIYEFEDSAVVEYISVTGMADEEVQNRLNQNLEDFYLWQWLYRSPDAEPDDNYYMGMASYSVIGDRYLSVLRILDTYDELHTVNGSTGAANENASAIVFDLITGEPAEELVYGGGAYKMGAAAEAFSQVFPEEDDPAAKSKFNEYMENTEFIFNYILTDYLLGIFIENENGDGYYRFDALYTDIPQMLSEELARAIAPELSIREEIWNEGRASFEYLVVAGMEDAEKQVAMNEDLLTFATWSLVNIEKPDRNITATTEYALFGKKYLSVRLYETEYEDGVAEPLKRIKSKLYDLDTGEYAGWLKDFIRIDSELGAAFATGSFKQVYPETAVEGGAEKLVAAIMADDPLTYDTGFYLTDSTLGLYLQESGEGQEDYLAFEAEFANIKSLVLPGAFNE